MYLYHISISRFVHNESVLTTRSIVDFWEAAARQSLKDAQPGSYAFGPQGSGPDPATSRDE